MASDISEEGLEEGVGRLQGRKYARKFVAGGQIDDVLHDLVATRIGCEVALPK